VAPNERAGQAVGDDESLCARDIDEFIAEATNDAQIPSAETHRSRHRQL